METGLLWFDDSPGALSERVRRAVEYYAQKFGRSPTLCLVNPAMLDKGDRPVAGIQVRAVRTVMPNHFFIGEEHKARAHGDGNNNGRANGDARGNGRAKSAKSRSGSARKRSKDGSA
jgi:hypothetical protein